MNEEQHDRLLTKLRRELGPQILEALADDSVIEVMLNPDGRLWVERFGASKAEVGKVPRAQSESIVSTVAAMLDTTVTYERPSLEGELPLDGSRFTALGPPVVAAMSWTIRKRARRVFTLDDYAAAEILSQEQYDALVLAIAERRNILVSGGTGSGKTTLLNAVIHGMSTMTPDDRLVVIEDTGELQCAARDVVTMRAVGHFSIASCLKTTLRFRPERIVIGEVRGGEAMPLLKSWNTGHEGGACTVHANNARLALMRLQSLIAEAPEASNYTPGMVRALIGEAVHVVVHIARDHAAKGGRRIKEVVMVEGLEAGGGDYRLRPIY